jgi:heme exporter protein B
MIGLLAGARSVMRKDLLAEGRAGEVLWVTIPFGALALLLFPLAIESNLTLLQTIGPGIFWVVVLLFGVLVTMRSTGTDPDACRDLLLLSGIQPAALFLGRAGAAATLVLVFELALTPVAIVFYSPQISGWAWLGLLAVLIAIGLGALGTLAGALSHGLRSRSAVAPLLVIPLAAPMLLAATEVTDVLQSGQSIIQWVLLLLAMDLTLIIIGMAVAGPLEESMG